MVSDGKKLQMFLCLIAGGGLFLPLIKAIYAEETVSFSFMKTFESGNEVANTVDSRILLGIIIALLILLFVRVQKDNAILKIISVLAVISIGVIYYIDVEKIFTLVKAAGDKIKYGLGFYASIVGIGAMIIVGLADFFSKPREEYSRLERVVDNYKNNPQTNNSIYQNNQPNVNNNQNNNLNPPVNNNNNINQIKLSDLVNKSNNNDINNNDINNGQNN